MVASNTPIQKSPWDSDRFSNFFSDLNIGVPDFDGETYATGGSGQHKPPEAAPSTVSFASAGGSGTVKTAAPIVAVTSVAASPFTIAINWDTSVSTAPAAFKTDVIAAVQYLQSQFTDAVSLTINVGYGEVAGNAIGNALGASLSNATTVTYANLVAALGADKKTAADTSAVASLPAATPIAGATYWVTTAQAKALGLAVPAGVDGSIGFGASSLFTYGATATSGTIATGTYDFFAAVVHELTEVMGRRMFTGSSQGGYLGSYTIMDLMHYSAPGTRDLSATTAGYFSADGGTTSLGALNTATGGDAGDWASTVTNDAFDAFAPSGVVEVVTANDLTVMDVLGWNPASAPAASTLQPTGVTIVPNTSALGSIQGSSGLAAKNPLARFAQTGGATADIYTYALGGTGASSFTLSTSNNIGTLSTGSVSVGGATSGKLYALTVTATDTSSGKSAPAAAVNVIVGASSADTINLASISGIVAAAPSFIYGLAGADTIVATGLTGSLVLVGGAGADTFTGGSGANRYEYASASESTVSAADIVKNFNVALDLIDLTGLGSKFSSTAALATAATTIAAGTIGWQAATIGGAAHTFVYVNNSVASEALTAANMKIDLLGGIALTGANIVHL